MPLAMAQSQGDSLYLRDPKVIAVVDRLISALAKDKPVDVLKYIQQWPSAVVGAESGKSGASSSNSLLTNTFNPAPPPPLPSVQGPLPSRLAARAGALSNSSSPTCPYVLPKALLTASFGASASTSPSIKPSGGMHTSPKHSAEALRAKVKAASTSYGCSPHNTGIPMPALSDTSRTAPSGSAAPPNESTTPLMLPASSGMLFPVDGDGEQAADGAADEPASRRQLTKTEVAVQTDISIGCSVNSQEDIAFGLSTMGLSAMGDSAHHSTRRLTSATAHSMALKTVASWTKGVLASLPTSPNNAQSGGAFPIAASQEPAAIEVIGDVPQKPAPLDGSVLVAGTGAFFSKNKPVKLKELKKIFPAPAGILGLVNNSQGGKKGGRGSSSKPSSPTSNANNSSAKSSPTKKDFASHHFGNNKRNSTQNSPTSKHKGAMDSYPSCGSLNSSMDFGGKEVAGQGNYGTVCQGVLLGSSHSAYLSNDGQTFSSLNKIASTVAIKITKIKDKWSLDEVEALRHCSQAAALVAKLGVGALWPFDGKVELDSTQQRHIDEDLVVGSKRMISLAGQVCYDPRSHSLWVPLPWLPLTLDGLIQHRKKQLWGELINDNRSKPNLFTLLELQVVFRQLLQASYFLGAAAKVAHLDIKPANVLIATSCTAYTDVYFDNEVEGDGHSSIVLCDCGLMQHIGDTLCQLGDYLYMAPEVYYCDVKEASRAKGESDDEESEEGEGDEEDDSAPHDDDWERGGADADGAEDGPPRHKKTTIHVFTDRNDIWSIGCVMLEMLEGVSSVAWEAADAFGAMKENYLAPSPKHVSQWPGDLVHCIAMCFERDPRLRLGARELLTHPFFQNGCEEVD